MGDLEDDVPLGAAGRLIGLRVVAPPLQDGEELRWSARANRFQSRFRSVGGRLYLTDRRLIFARTKFESKVGGSEWSADLADLESAAPGSVRSIEVKWRVGHTERFVVASKVETASLLDEAIKAAAKRRPV